MSYALSSGVYEHEICSAARFPDRLWNLRAKRVKRVFSSQFETVDGRRIAIGIEDKAFLPIDFYRKGGRMGS